MITVSAYQYKSVNNWLSNLLLAGKISPDDEVYKWDNGSYGVGDWTVEDEEEYGDDEVRFVGHVKDYVFNRAEYEISRGSMSRWGFKC